MFTSKPLFSAHCFGRSICEGLVAYHDGRSYLLLGRGKGDFTSLMPRLHHWIHRKTATGTERNEVQCIHQNIDRKKKKGIFDRPRASSKRAHRIPQR